MITWTFLYLNHRGETKERTIDVECLEFIPESNYGYQPGWFISGRCYDKNARRSFALSRILMPETKYPRLAFYMKEQQGASE
jgi:hypothetical protein